MSHSPGEGSIKLAFLLQDIIEKGANEHNALWYYRMTVVTPIKRDPKDALGKSRCFRGRSMILRCGTPELHHSRDDSAPKEDVDMD